MISSKRRSTQNRQSADALLRCGVNRVAQRRGQRRHRRLACPGWRLCAFYKVSLDLRYFVHPDWRIVVEISLQYASLLNRDLSAQGICQSKGNSALDLLFEDAGIDHLPAVHHTCYAMH